MTKIKLCGLSTPGDMDAANDLRPDYIGFVFAEKSRRYVSPKTAQTLRGLLRPEIAAVGVFVDAPPETVAALLAQDVIQVAQLHGREDGEYLRRLRALTDRPIFQAFRLDGLSDALRAEESAADTVFLDSGSGGSGSVFDWSLARQVHRPYFLAGGLSLANVSEALRQLSPYGVDVSSGIETDGRKDPKKMKEFVQAVRAFDSAAGRIERTEL